jgi:hypothetical protein
MSIRIRKRIYIPTDGIYEMSVASTEYVSSIDHHLIQCVTKGAVLFTGKKRYYYSAEGFIRRSKDNGESFQDKEILYTFDPTTSGQVTRMIHPKFVLDKKNDILIMFYTSFIDDTSIPQFSYDSLCMKTCRPVMRISNDGGRTWGPDMLIRDKSRDENDPEWAEGIRYGFNGAALICSVWINEDTLMVGLTVYKPMNKKGELVYTRSGNAYTTGVKFATGVWNEDKSNMIWTFGDTVTVNPSLTLIGCNEPCITKCAGDVIFAAMRTQGSEHAGLFSGRYCSVSYDGGMTWSEPELLRYDDGTVVHNPAAFANFFTSKVTHKTYFMTNILKEPVYGQTPRYPLHIAEFDTKSMRVIKDSVQVIQNLPKCAPVERRYTNWSQYEDRVTGELVMHLPELPKYKNFSEMDSNNDMQADCLEYRLQLQ